MILTINIDGNIDSYFEFIIIVMESLNFIISKKFFFHNNPWTFLFKTLKILLVKGIELVLCA
jgi:flagellar biosynthesis protein FliR